MQYPVPQFTDVEDKIFGPLTLKQFGILGVPAAITFVVYSSTKDLVITVLVGLFLGVPALGLAFGKINGRPLYSSVGSILGFFLKPRFMLFHKEPQDTAVQATKAKPEEPAYVPQSDASSRKQIKNLFYSLGQQQEAEGKLIQQAKKK